MAIPPDVVQAFHGHCDNIPGVLSGHRQPFPCDIAVIGFSGRKRGCLDKGGYVSAVLTFLTQFLSRPGCGLARGLTQAFKRGDPLIIVGSWICFD